LRKLYQPYTYLIRFKPTLQLYYGAKTAKGCHPDQLWIKYFTSSKVVKRLIKEYGKDAFEIVHIKLHETKEDALKWEELYLTSVDAGYNREYLNRHNGSKNFTQSGKHPSRETLNKLSKSTSGENNGFFGKNHSEETLKIMKENHRDYSGENHPQFGKTGELSHNYGKKHTEEALKLMSIAQSGENHPAFGKFGKDNPKSKKYIITSPDGHEEIIIGLVQFCKEHKLLHSMMYLVVKNKRKHHHNFKCRYFIEDIDIQPNN
jgi:hypothetical protein